MKECFTCVNRVSIDLTKDQKRDLRKQGLRLIDVPDTLRICTYSGNPIKLTYPACDGYSEDSVMHELRIELSKTAKKLRQELDE